MSETGTILELQTHELKNMKRSNFHAETALSELFRENHHEALKTVIESWRPYLVGGDAGVEALEICHLGFDLTRIRVGRVYRDLAVLINHDALIPPLVELARYLAAHSNLAMKPETAYRQLKRYCSIYR